jgi:hypothetical protein
MTKLGRAIAQAVSRRLPTAAARVRSQVTSSGICGGKMALGQVSPEYFGFPCQFSFHWLLDTHHHHLLPYRAGTISQMAADVPSGLILTLPQEIRIKEKTSLMSIGRKQVNSTACTANPLPRLLLRSLTHYCQTEHWESMNCVSDSWLFSMF